MARRTSTPEFKAKTVAPSGRLARKTAVPLSRRRSSATSSGILHH